LVGNEAESRAPRARELFTQHNGNLRDVFRAFYDDAANEAGHQSAL
jgi:hypothetical protein